MICFDPRDGDGVIYVRDVDDDAGNPVGRIEWDPTGWSYRDEDIDLVGYADLGDLQELVELLHADPDEAVDPSLPFPT